MLRRFYAPESASHPPSLGKSSKGSEGSKLRLESDFLKEVVRSILLPGHHGENGGVTPLTLRPRSDFLRWVLGTPAKTVLGSISPGKDLPITVVKPGIGRKDLRPWAKN